jgi:hypothetical protein
LCTDGQITVTDLNHVHPQLKKAQKIKIKNQQKILKITKK